MKKNILFSVFGAVAVMFASCSQQQEMPAVDDEMVPLRIDQVSIEGTRIGSNDSHFEKGDTLGLYINNTLTARQYYNVPAVFNGSYWEIQERILVPRSENGPAVYVNAYYPFSSKYVTVPANTNENYLSIPNGNVLAAHSYLYNGGFVIFEFRHVLARMVFNFINPEDSSDQTIEIRQMTFDNDSQVVPNFYGFLENTLRWQDNIWDYPLSDLIRLRVEPGLTVAPGGTATYERQLPPSTLTAPLHLEMLLNDEWHSVEIPTLNFQRGVTYTYNIRLTAGGTPVLTISPDSDIQEWTENEVGQYTIQ